MTLGQLLEALQDIAEEHGADVEVRLAHQPQWAFEYSIDDVVLVEASEPSEDDEDADQEEPVVYIAEKSQLGYLGGAAAKALGWNR